MKRLVIALMIAAGAVPFLLCAAQPVKVTGIYSNMALHQESGDVLGIELFVIISSKGYVVVFQNSEGEPAVPVIAPARIEGKQIEFTLPADCAYAGGFTGTFTDDGITGSFSSGRLGPRGEKVIRLKKGKSYWQH